MKAFTFLALSAVLAACDKKDETPATASSASASSAAAVTSAAVSDNDIPSEEDFEDEAEKDITPDNLDQEIAAMEKEIDSP